MPGMRIAPGTVFPELNPLGMQFLILCQVIIPVLALLTGQDNLNPHLINPLISVKYSSSNCLPSKTIQKTASKLNMRASRLPPIDNPALCL
jgi:hypothetical protein